ncbi:MAG: hypothetical protein LBL86_12185 [Coriobacteriales bacterium]|jgi:hypothetical protein|nr:hypothetical protein [Coriobacteriales bacterium]
MPNSIAYAERFVPVLDAIYQDAALSGALDTSGNLLGWLAGTREFRLGRLSMDGLGDYDRSLGYPAGDVTLDWETHAPDWERGRMFTVDCLDNEESLDLVWANLSGEFLRTHVAPELDAVRFAKYAALAGNTVAARIADAAALLAALRVATNTLDEAQVPDTDRLLFVTPSLIAGVDDLDTTKSRAVLSRFSSIVHVPQARFYTAVETLDGKSPGEEAGGYAKADGAEDVNFLVVHRPAVLQALRHVAPKIVDPAANQSADAWKFGYRAYGIADVQELKAVGLYLHSDLTPAPPAQG